MWIEEEAQELYTKPFHTLTNEAKEIVLRNIEAKSNGSSFLTSTLNFINESLLGDPHYNINMEQKGWKWLNHYPGSPRPSESQIYSHYGKGI